MSITQHIAFQPVEFCLALGVFAMLVSGAEMGRRFLYGFLVATTLSLLSIAMIPPGYSFQVVVGVSGWMILLLSIELGLKAFPWAIIFGGLVAVLAPHMELPFFVSWSSLLSSLWACFTIRELNLERKEAGLTIWGYGFWVFILLAALGAVTSFPPNFVALSITSLGVAFIGLGYYARQARGCDSQRSNQPGE